MTNYAPSLIAVEIAAILRGYRARRGLTQGQLAEAVEVDQSHWSSLERAKRPLTVDQLNAACAALGVSTEQVVAEAHAAVTASQQG